MLNDEIRRLRKASGLNQVSFADKMGVSQSTVASWENGTRRPDLDALCKIADLFNVSLDELLGRKQPSPDSLLNEQMQSDPTRRTLYELARHGKDRDVEQAVAILHVIMRDQPDDHYERKGNDPA